MIADSSALVAFYLNEETKPLLEKEFLRERTATIDLALKEILNAVLKRVRRKKIDRKDGSFILDRLMESVEGKVIEILPQINLLRRATTLSFKHNLSIYDTLFIAAALEEKEELLTLDQAQAEAAQKEGVVVIKLGYIEQL